MGRNEHEAKALRRDTASFIASDPTVFVLRRRERVPDGAGGWLEDEETVLEPQVVKVQPRPHMRPNPVESVAGTVARPGMDIVGMPDLDINENDKADWQGKRWRVVFVDRSVGYRRIAEVVLDGS
jgi:hypothetical protein